MAHAIQKHRNNLCCTAPSQWIPLLLCLFHRGTQCSWLKPHPKNTSPPGKGCMHPNLGPQTILQGKQRMMMHLRYSPQQAGASPSSCFHHLHTSGPLPSSMVPSFESPASLPPPWQLPWGMHQGRMWRMLGRGAAGVIPAPSYPPCNICTPGPIVNNKFISIPEKNYWMYRLTTFHSMFHPHSMSRTLFPPVSTTLPE